MSTVIGRMLSIRIAASFLAAVVATILHIAIVALGNITVGWGFDVALEAIYFLAAFIFAFGLAGFLRVNHSRVLMSISLLVAVISSGGYFLALRTLGRVSPAIEWASFALTSLGVVFFAAAVAKFLISRNTVNEK